MKTLIFNDEITYDSVNDLINDIEEGINSGEEVTVYFQTVGGDYSSGLVLIDYINQNKNSITLVGYEELSSTGFSVFFRVDCKKKLLEGVFSLVHLTARSVETRNIKNSKHIDKFFLDESKRNHDAEMVWLKQIGLYDKEIASVKKGEDLFLTDSRLNELLNRQNKK